MTETDSNLLSPLIEKAKECETGDAVLEVVKMALETNSSEGKRQELIETITVAQELIKIEKEQIKIK